MIETIIRLGFRSREARLEMSILACIEKTFPIVNDLLHLPGNVEPGNHGLGSV